MVDSSASEDSEALTDDDVPLDERLRMVTISTQTPGTMLDYVHEFARRSSLSLVSLQDNRNQFWDHVLSCIKMPRGGLDGGGSQHCSFEFVAASEGVVQFIMEDLEVVQNQRYNMSLPPPHWEQSPSISTHEPSPPSSDDDADDDDDDDGSSDGGDSATQDDILTAMIDAGWEGLTDPRDYCFVGPCDCGKISGTGRRAKPCVCEDSGAEDDSSTDED